MPANRVYTQPATMARSVIERIYRPDNWGAHWFGRALPRVSGGAATDIAKVHWYGDSLTVGDDASSVFGQSPAAANSTAQKDAWRADGAVGVFRRKMQERYGNSGEGFQPFGLAVTTGTWTTRIGFGVSAARATAAASATWKVLGTSVKIFGKQAALTGEFRYQIDGGAFTNVVNGTLGFGVDPFTVTVGSLSDGEHTVRVEWVSGTIEISGVQGLRAAAGVLVDRCALHGAAIGPMGNAPTSRRVMSVATTNGSPNLVAGTGGYFTQADVGARISGTGIPTGGAFIGSVSSATAATLVNSAGVAANATATATNSMAIDSLARGAAAPTYDDGFNANVWTRTTNPALAEGLGYADLVICAFGVNESAAGYPEMTDHFIDAASKMAGQYAPTAAGIEYGADFVFVIHHIGKWFDIEKRYGMWASAIRSAAAGLNGAVIDLWDAGRRSYDYAQDERYWAGAAADNTVHLSKLGHEMLGEAMLALARQ